MGCGSSSKSNDSQPAPTQQGSKPAASAGQAAPKAVLAAGPGEKIEDAKLEYDPDIERELAAQRVDKQGQVVGTYDRKADRPEDTQAFVSFFEVESAGAGDQALAVKPWKGALKAPTNPPPFKNDPPAVNLTLEYVYGYRTTDTRQNAFYTANPDEIVYPAAALGIVLNKTSNTQKFFGAGTVKTANGHTDDVTALAIHPGKDFVATGDVGANPKIAVWKASNPAAAPVAEIKLGRGARAVTTLGFSSDGKYIAAADLSNDHVVAVWEWQTGRQVYKENGGPDKILHLSWSKTSPTFATVGIKHVYFWKIGATSGKNKGIFGAAGPVVNMTTAGWLPDETCVTGGANGSLYHWNDKQLQKTVQAHAAGAAIHSLIVTRTSVVTGGADNKIKVLNLALQEQRSIDLPSIPKSLDLHDNGNILVGLKNGSVYEIVGTKLTELISSHFDGEVWGLAVSPSPNLFVTSGDDNTVFVWDARQRRKVGSAVLEAQAGPARQVAQGASTLATTAPNQQSRGIAINPRNGHVAIGHNDGHFTIRSSVTNLTTIVATGKDAASWIEVVVYSPDGSRLAIGSHDNFIYIYDVASNYRLLNKLQGHTAAVLSLDWSVDGASIHSSCLSYELLFWEASTGRQIKDGATTLKDEKWATWSTKLGWPVQGIFGGVTDYTHVYRVDRSPDSQVVAVANDWGLVELYGYPNSEQAKSQAFRGHSQHVTNVRWSADGAYVYSTGGYDQAVLQWRRS